MLKEAGSLSPQGLVDLLSGLCKATDASFLRKTHKEQLPRGHMV